MHLVTIASTSFQLLTTNQSIQAVYKKPQQPNWTNFINLFSSAQGSSTVESTYSSKVKAISL